MSEFHVEVVRLGPNTKHENADTLSVTMVHGGYPVIVRTGEYTEGQLAVYVPVDSIIPENDSRWEFLAGHRRIRAKKLRGVFSMGLLTQADPTWAEGQNVAVELGITKYEAPEPGSPGFGPSVPSEPGPDGWIFPKYTDIEGLRRHQNVLAEGEDVVLTEKIHGANARYCHDGERLWIGSRTQVKRNDDGNQWAKVAEAEGLAEKLSRQPFFIFYGEIFGNVQDLKYGMPTVAAFRCFDVFDVKGGRYLNHFDARSMAEELGIPWVPELYVGPWVASELVELAEGQSTLAAHVREGFVVKPVRERFHHIGRVILKQPGQGYLLRKSA